MLKRKFDETDAEIRPDTSLSHHPLNFLIPTEPLISLAAPYEANIPSETILFSQEEMNDKISQIELLGMDLWKSEDPDIKYIRFKKPISRDLELNVSQPLVITQDINDGNLIADITPVSKKDFVKTNLSVTKIHVHDNNENDQMLDQILKLYDENGTTKAPEVKDIKTENPKSSHPEFTYDSKITQSVLLTHSSHELGVYFELISNLLSKDFDNVSDSQEVVIFENILSGAITLTKPEVLSAMRSKIQELITANTHDLIDSEKYLQLLNYCVNIIKETFSIDWDCVFEIEDVVVIEEHCAYFETVVYASTIIILLYSDDIIHKHVANEKGLSIVVDFITAFGTSAKMLYQREEWNNLPDFFTPFVTQFKVLLSFLSQKLPFLNFNESAITRLEYVAFDLVFVDIIHKRERASLNVYLEQLRFESASILIGIYLKYQDQREFLLNEVIENMNSISPLKSKAKKLRLNTGQSVQLVSYLIVEFLQCHREFGKGFDVTEWSFLTLSHETKAKSLQLQEIEDSFWASINNQINSLKKSVENFSVGFVKKILQTYTPNLRKVVENFIADFVLMMHSSEFPVCSIFLEGILDACFQFCVTAEITSGHALLFEIIGILGSAMLSLKQISGISLDSNITLPNLIQLSDAYFTTLSALEVKKTNMGSCEFVKLQYLSSLQNLRQTFKVELNAGDSLMGENQKERKALLKELDSIITRVIELSNENNDFDYPSQLVLQETYSQVLASQDFTNRYSDVLGFILKSLTNTKAKSKTMAIKNLTLLIDREPKLFEDVKLRIMIKNTVMESSATIVDAALDLLRKILECKSDYISEYYEVLALKIRDPSVNVKKKTTGIISYMFLNTTDYKIKVRLSQALLTQLDDEEDRVVDLICLKLAELLFLNIKIAFDNENRSSQVNSEAVESLHVLCGIYQLGTTTWDFFERYFDEKIVFGGYFNQRIRLQLHSSLEKLVETMVLLITDSGDISAVNLSKFINVETAMGVLATFVKSDRGLIAQHQLVAIQPYIINDFESSEMCYHALTILNITLDQHKPLNRAFVNTCRDSLMKRLTKFNARELDQSIQCIWKLYLIDNDTSSVAKACVSSLKLLLKYIAQLQVSIKTFKPDPAVPRLLYLLGNFGRYCKFERDRKIFIDAKLGLQEKENISVFLLKFILKFCDSSIIKPLRKIAIKNALNICTSHPRLFFSTPVTKLIDSTFRKKDSEISDIIIGAMLMFLENEEKQMLKKNGLDAKRSSAVKLDIAIFHGYSLEYMNDGICSTLVQKYLGNILDACLGNNTENSMNAIKFLKLVVKFGFSNPKICFPTIVALECSRSAYVRHIALELHKFLFDKFETLVESTYSESLKAAVKYAFSIYKLEELQNCAFFLRSFYKIVKTRNSKQRIEKFLQSIQRSLSSVSMYKFQRLNTDELIMTQNQIIFLCVNLNEMVFEKQSDLLMIINHIEKIILSEENIFGDQFNLIMDMFDDEDDKAEKFRYLVMAKVLLAAKSLIKCLMTNYTISPDLILRYQEDTDKKSFYTSITNTENNRFFNGEIKMLLTKPVDNQLTLLYNKLTEITK